ncbi:MAG: hypothetical protein ABIU09_12815 [Pyrinomonadaceae bacterium]
MMKIFWSLPLVFLFVFAGFAQIKKTAPAPSGATVPIRSMPKKDDTGVKSTGGKYTNDELRFAITIPEPWLIADREFDKKISEQGIDLALKAPDGLSKVSRVQLNRALDRVTILLTAYRPTFTTEESALIRVSRENITSLPEVRDAVDYFDLMRSQFRVLKLPPGLTYSKTQAEKLGQRQFAFIDIATEAGKKRMYATVKNRYAILFTVSYKDERDLQTMRQILSEGNFFLK